jgi:hypothetical protein
VLGWQLLEQEGYLARGKSVVVGDNILFPGAPDYLAYVTAKPPAEKGEGAAVSGQGGRVSEEVVSSDLHLCGWLMVVMVGQSKQTIQ